MHFFPSQFKRPWIQFAKQKQKQKQINKNLTIKICVDFVVHFWAGSEIDDLDFVCSGVDQDVLVFDVAMNNSGGVHLIDGGHDLLEDELGQVLLDGTGIRNEVEQIFARPGPGRGRAHPLHDDHEAVRKLEVVDQPDDTRDVGDLLHQRDFNRHESFPFALWIRRQEDERPVLWDGLDGDRELVRVPETGVDGAEAALAQHGADCVELCELLLADDCLNWKVKEITVLFLM